MLILSCFIAGSLNANLNIGFHRKQHRLVEVSSQTHVLDLLCGKSPAETPRTFEIAIPPNKQNSEKCTQEDPMWQDGSGGRMVQGGPGRGRIGAGRPERSLESFGRLWL